MGQQLPVPGYSVPAGLFPACSHTHHPISPTKRPQKLGLVEFAAPTLKKTENQRWEHFAQDHSWSQDSIRLQVEPAGPPIAGSFQFTCF